MSSFSPKTCEPILPVFKTTAGRTEAEELEVLAKDGLKTRLRSQTLTISTEEVFKPSSVEPYFDRLDFELHVIKQMGFPGYFLIVADFIQWAKNQNIPVGPGRGSGAGSLVAWLCQ